MTPPRDDILRMAREAGLCASTGACALVGGADLTPFLQRFADLAVADFLARTPPPPIMVNTADLDPALLRDMLAKAPPMQLRPIPPDAALEAERAARIAAQTEAVELKERLARSGVEERRAVAAEREACAGLMASLRAKSRNHLFRSALAIAEGEIRARGTA